VLDEINKKKNQEDRPCNLNYVSMSWNLGLYYVYISAVANSVTFFDIQRTVHRDIFL